MPRWTTRAPPCSPRCARTFRPRKSHADTADSHAAGAARDRAHGGRHLRACGERGKRHRIVRATSRTVERWSPAPADPFATNSAADIFSHRSPEWPALVDPRAAHCDAASRLALADALATVRGPWADAILHRALDDEPDALVRDAIVAALGSAVAR
jgi:hypothetical protein